MHVIIIPRRIKRGIMDVGVSSFLDDFSDGPTNVTVGILAFTVVTEDIPTAHAVLNVAMRLLTVRNMPPQNFHLGTVRSDSTRPSWHVTFGSMPEQK
jgi:hypothetical protein